MPPMSCTYVWYDESTGESLFMVEVSRSGAINVLKDDWLSKYTMAIHQTINVDKVFVRIDQNTGVCSEISNVDMIYEDEVILHFPTLLYFIDWLRKRYYTRSDYPKRIPPEDLKDLFVVKGTDPFGAASPALSAFMKSIEQLLGSNPLKPLFSAIKAIAKYQPVLMDGLRSTDTELIIEKFYASVLAQVYWVYTDTEIDYAARTPNIQIPSTDTNNLILEPYIPSLPFKVNSAFANPIVWIEKYADSFFRNNSDSQIQLKLSIMKSIWEEKFNGTVNIMSAFQIFESAYEDAKLVTKGGRPNLLKTTFKLEMRTYGNYEFTPSEYYDQVCQNYLEMVQKEWKGVTAPLRLLENFVNNQNKHYRLDIL
jgi:hypothetical protein